MLPRTRAWVESWNRVKTLPEPELKTYILNKCRNGFQVAKKPDRDQLDAWVTLLAEPDKSADQLSDVAQSIIAFVRQRLTEDGYDFELNVDETGGVAYAEVHFRTLTRAPRARKSRSAGTRKATKTRKS